MSSEPQQKKAKVGDAAAGADDAAPPKDQRPAADLPDGLIEQGRAWMLYRPKVASAGSADTGASSAADIQRLYIILQPDARGSRSRLIVVPKKHLPDTHAHERLWAFVEAVADTPAELTAQLTESQYSTKTRGERVQPAARAAAQGSYVLAKGGPSSSGGVRLGFKMTSPQEPGEAQTVLGILMEGSYVLNAKNPANKTPGAPSAGPEPEYSEEQQQEFGSRSWIGVEDASLLDVVGTELLLVGARDDPIESGELGAASKQLEQLAEADAAAIEKQGPAAVLKEALEPAGDDAAGAEAAKAAAGSKKRSRADSAEGQDEGQAGGEPIPVGPAVDGQLK